MNFADYLAADGVNWSSLKHILRSPLHYRHAQRNPKRDTPALSAGRGAHVAILEPDRYARQYIVIDEEAWDARDLDRTTKEGKARAAEFYVAHPEAKAMKADAYKAAVMGAAFPGKEIIPAATQALHLAMRDAVHGHAIASQYVRGPGANEVSHFWTDPTSGLRCKGRFDRVSDRPSALVDVKTTVDVDSRLFGSSAAKLAYHAQLAFYQAGWHATTGVMLPCVIVAVESEPPHDVALVDVDEDSLQAGREDVARAIALLVECRAKNEWPGRYPQRVALQLPSYVFPDGDMADLGLDFGDDGEQEEVA
jgi:hypothetical protein